MTLTKLLQSPNKIMLAMTLVPGIKSPDTGSFCSRHHTLCSNHCEGPAPRFQYSGCLSEFQYSVCRDWSTRRRDGWLTLQSPWKINRDRRICDQLSLVEEIQREGRNRARKDKKLFFWRWKKNKSTSSFLWLLQNFLKQSRLPGKWW